MELDINVKEKLIKEGIIKEEDQNDILPEGFEDDLAAYIESNKSETDKIYADIQDGKIPSHIPTTESETMEVQATIDPVTGKISGIENNFLNDMDDLERKTIEDYLGADYDSPDYIDQYEATDLIKNNDSTLQAVKELLEERFKIKDVDDYIIYNIIKLIKDYKAIFKDLDLSDYDLGDFPNKIYKANGGNLDISVLNDKIVTPVVRDALEQIATMLLMKTVSDIQVDLSDSINNYIKEEVGGDVYGRWIEHHKSLNGGILESLSDNEDPKVIERAEMVVAAYKESYQLTEFISLLSDKKIKIRKIDVEKPHKVFRDFNSKYSKTKWVIKDINMLPNILDRNLNEEYDMKVITVLLLAFCQYTRLMKPTNIKEHTLMYYFINNITMLDLYNNTVVDNNENEIFFNEFKDTLNSILRIIIDKYKELL